MTKEVSQKIEAPHLWLTLEQSDREVVPGSRVMSNCRTFRSRISNPQPNPQKVCLI